MNKIKLPKGKKIYLQQLKNEVQNLGEVSIIGNELVWSGSATPSLVDNAVGTHKPNFPMITPRDLKAEYAAAVSTNDKLNIIAEVLNLI